MRKSPDPVDVFVGQRLRIRRLAVQMSQEKLAEQVGLTFQQVQKYEKGANRISASRMHQFATILGVPAAFFFDGLDQHGAPSSDPGTAFLATREGAAIAQAWGGLSDAGRAAVLAVVQSLPAIRRAESTGDA